MRRFAKIGIGIFLFWIACGLTVWFFIEPGERLVGLNRQAAVQAPKVGSENLGVAEALAVLEKTLVWGVRRNGSPLPPPASKQQQEEKKIVWSVVGVVVGKDERYVLVRVEKEAPQQIKIGESLPDGSKLLKVFPSGYTVESTEGGNMRTIEHFIVRGK